MPIRKWDKKAREGTVRDLILNNEANRKVALDNYKPLLFKIYLKFKPEHSDSLDMTVPLPDRLYNLIYVRKFKPSENILIAEILEKYIKSGSNLELALLEITKMKQLGPHKQKLFNEMLDSLKTAGVSPAEAMEEHAKGLIDDRLIRALDIGHKSNRTQELLLNYIEDTRYEMENNGKIKKALIYPGIIGVLIAGMCIAGKLMLLPEFMPVALEGEVAVIPAQFRPMVTVADLFLKPYRLLVLLAFLKTIQIIVKKSQTLTALSHFAVVQVPVINDYLITKDVCGLFIHLHSEIDAGIPTLEAHEDACKSLQNSVLKDVFTSKTEAMIEGTALSDAYNEITYLDEDIKTLLRISEKNGSLPEALTTCTGILKERYQAVTDMVISLMPTISMLVAGLAVFILFIPIFLGMYEIESMLN